MVSVSRRRPIVLTCLVVASDLILSTRPHLASSGIQVIVNLQVKRQRTKVLTRRTKSSFRHQQAAMRRDEQRPKTTLRSRDGVDMRKKTIRMRQIVDIRMSLIMFESHVQDENHQ